MWLDKILTFLVPKDKTFFVLFAKASANVVEISKALTEYVNAHSAEKKQDLMRKIYELENVGDNITHEILTELSTNFITPFDREDIHYLATSLDDIADFIYGAAKRMELYRIEENPEAFRKLAELIEKSANEINIAVFDLRSMDNIVRIKEACVRINSLENHADDIFHTAIADLFQKENDAKKLIIYQDILATLETATDKCEDVANVIETILVKNS
jgi:predicted phosphate transport protein (TIGR00153 family)